MTHIIFTRKGKLFTLKGPANLVKKRYSELMNGDTP